MAEKKPRIKLIMNPNADMGNAWRHAWALQPIIEEYGNADWSGTVYPTHAEELARQAARDRYDLVIAVGGDGTVHEVINGLMQVRPRRRPRLGVVPMGSGNDFAHVLGMAEEPDKALRQVIEGAPRKIDIGVIEDNHGRKAYWDNTLSIGFGGAVTIYSHRLPVLRGFLMYLVAVMQTIIARYDVMQMKITTENGSWEDELLMLAVCNGPREGGGFQTAPEALIDDGLLNFTAVKKMSRLMMFRMIPEFMNGTQGRFKKIHMDKIKRIEIESKQPLHLHTDGEVFANFNSGVHQLKIEVIPDALEVMV
jgi:YegS/Rv2252/BmrU family lipid kinase